MRIVRLTLASALVAALTPLALGAQGASFPRCKDGTVATRTGYTACWFHGGVADGKTVAAARPAAPARTAPAKPASASRSAATSPSKVASRSDSRSAKAARKASKDKAKAKQAQKRKQAKAAKPASTVFGVPVASASKAGASKPRASSKSSMRVPKGATARCMDGSFTTAQRKKKACARHGGVAGWIRPDIPPE